MSDKQDFVIWWLSQASCTAIDSACYLFPWPAYLRSEFQSRIGRSGRGRLWIPKGIDLEEIPWPNPETDVSRRANQCGGIVMWRRDLAHVHDLPGFVTDLDMNEIPYVGIPREIPGSWQTMVAGALAYASGNYIAEADIRAVVEQVLNNLRKDVQP